MMITAYSQVSNGSKISPQEKQKPPLTNEDKNTLRTLFNEKLAIARTINNLHYRSIIVSDIALDMAKKGLDKNEVIKVFEEALYWEETQINELCIKNPDDNRRVNILDSEAVAIKWILSKMAKARLNKSDIEKACNEVETDIWVRAEFCIDRQKYPLTEKDKSDLLIMFNEKLKAVRKNEDTGEQKAEAISEIALGMAFAGADKNKLCNTFREAIKLEVAYTNKQMRENPDDNIRDMIFHYETLAIRKINSLMSDAGLDQSDKEDAYHGFIDHFGSMVGEPK